MLYAWGANSYAQLCLGNKEDYLTPQKCKIDNQEGSKIAKIIGGGGHTTILTEHGQVLFAGSNQKGELGFEKSTSTVSSPICHERLPSSSSIACGWSHTLVCTGVDAFFYSAGSNSFGQLGSSLSGCSYSFNDVKVNGVVKMVAAGMNHSLILTESGEVFACGASKKGQLGYSKSPEKCSKSLVQVDFGTSKERITKIAAGGNFTMSLTENGKVLCWGANNHGQCGLPSTKSISNSNDMPCSESAADFVYLPHLIDLPGYVIDIACGWSHCLALTDSGSVFSWGRFDYGQLGRDVNQHYQPDSISMSSSKRIQSICCGAEHSLALSNDGVVFAWGWNEHGMCGTGDEINVTMPTEVAAFDGKHASLIGCGAGTSFAVLQGTRI